MNRFDIRLHEIRRAHLCGLMLAIALTEIFLLPSVTGEDALSGPPCYPDSVHVLNGCHLSTIRYLAQFKSEYPSERGDVLVISTSDADRNHAVALITWHGQLWCRDEYFGVFSLDSLEPRPNSEVLVDRIENILRERAAQSGHKGGGPNTHLARGSISKDQRLVEVVRAKQIVPFCTTLFWIRSKNQEIPMLFFRPASQRIAVYDPLHGTCIASCECHDDSRIVSYVAVKFGYSVDGVRSG